MTCFIAQREHFEEAVQGRITNDTAVYAVNLSVYVVRLVSAEDRYRTLAEFYAGVDKLVVDIGIECLYAEAKTRLIHIFEQ